MEKLLKVELKNKVFGDERKTRFLTEQELKDFEESNKTKDGYNQYEILSIENANLDEYRSTYFRIESGYKWGDGMSQEMEEDFNKEIVELFSQYGWTIHNPSMSNSCYEVSKVKSKLYCHPQELSGAFQLNLLEEVKTICSKAKTFELYHIDFYKELKDMTDEEYKTYLDSKKEDIENDILAALKTPRKNLFKTISYDFIDNLLDKYRIRRLCNAINSITSEDIDFMYIQDTIQELVENGELATAETKNGLGYKTNKKGK